MMKQYAVCLAERIKQMEELEMSEPQVFFDVWKSLNNRYQQRMVRLPITIESQKNSIVVKHLNAAEVLSLLIFNY